MHSEIAETLARRTAPHPHNAPSVLDSTEVQHTQ